MNLTHSETDVVILRSTIDTSAPPILTRPLSPTVKIDTHKGTIRHADIIGRRPRDIVKSSSGMGFRIHNVSLGEYVRMSKRLVTPVSMA